MCASCGRTLLPGNRGSTVRDHGGRVGDPAHEERRQVLHVVDDEEERPVDARPRARASGRRSSRMTTAVAAAASVPSSSTATNASCRTVETHSSLPAGSSRRSPRRARRRRSACRVRDQRVVEGRLACGTSSGAARAARRPAAEPPRISGRPPAATAADTSSSRPSVRQDDGHRERPARRTPAAPPASRRRRPSGPTPAPAVIIVRRPPCGRCRWRSGRRRGGLGLERLRPRRLEVERVDEDQPGQRVEHAGRDDLGDPVVGLLAPSSR